MLQSRTEKTRKSEDKVVENTKTHDQLFSDYLLLLDQLISKYPISADIQFKELVNFKKNKAERIHNWFDYKQGYASELVSILLEHCKIPSNEFLLDPFNGVGTTQVVAQQKGIPSIGIDINPVATFTAKVKTHIYSDFEIDTIKKILNTTKNYKPSIHTPKYKKLNSIFNETQVKQILRIKGFWESIEIEAVRDFFKLAYLSIIEDCSNRVKDGNGIKIAKNKRVIPNIIEYFESKCKQMLSDLEFKNNSTNAEAIVIQGSLLDDKVFDIIRSKRVGGAIFSPPYANCFDYCEVYKMELWLGDFVKDYSDFIKYRSIAIRSHVNSKFDHKINIANSNVDLISSLINTYNIWNKNIPDMLRGYFDDMAMILDRLYSLLTKNSYCCIVVANSGYKGIVVPTDLLLTEIACKIGFKLDKIVVARNIRASSQQMKELNNRTNLMRESIIVLKK